MEIAKPIRLFIEQHEVERRHKPREPEASAEIYEIAKEIVREISSEIWKAGFNPDEPRAPRGNPDGGQWTREGGSRSANDGHDVPDATPDNNWLHGAYYAANDPSTIGRNQEPPLASPPDVPPAEPAEAKAKNAFLKAAAYWLAEAALAGEPAGDFILALEATEWLFEFRPWIDAYQDPPKTLQELQSDLRQLDGYDIHHIVEQTPAEKDGYSDSLINSPENLVRIPTLTHWLIGAWFSSKNDNYDGLTPRDYLRGKSWEERVRVGMDALTLFEVLKP
jgi:hypothetical protein